MFNGRLVPVSLCHFTRICPLLKVTRSMSTRDGKGACVRFPNIKAQLCLHYRISLNEV